MLFLICLLAFDEAVKDEKFEYFEGILVKIFAGLLALMAVTELVGEIYAVAALAYYILAPV